MVRLATSLCLVSTAWLTAGKKALAAHDYFLLGEPACVSAWPQSEQIENKFGQSPALKARQQLLIALYLAPLLIDQGKSVQALSLIPQRAKPDSDSLTFLQWRAALAAGRADNKVAGQVVAFLKKFNERAIKNNGVTCSDLVSLSKEYRRRGYLLDSDSLSYIAGRIKVAVPVNVSAREKEAAATKDYEEALADAYQFTLLDQVDSASAKFEKVASYLRSRNMQERPQSDAVRAEAQRVLDVQLAPFEGASKVDLRGDADIALLKAVLTRQIDLAYLAKVDGRLHEAAYQFRRAFALVQKYFPGTSDYSYLTYDLAETLLWDEKFDESISYFKKCLAERLATDRKSAIAIDTRNMLGRAYLRSGASKKGLDCFFDNLRAVGLLNGIDLPKSDAELPAVLVACVVSADKGDNRRLVDDALQGISDATIPLKQYNLGIAAGKQLLDLRSGARAVNKDAVMGSLWALAYACDSNAMPHEASIYYSQLIDAYAAIMPNLAPTWYHGRGLDYDQLGNHKMAAADLKLAVKLYQKRLDAAAKDASLMDEETRDRLTWTIEDLKYNLDLAHKYPSSHEDYADLPANNMWRLGSFPLKVYIAQSGAAGFGGPLLKVVRGAVETWTGFAESPLTVKYVDKLEDADIFVERVSSYDDIPYSSAGRTSANFEHSADFLEAKNPKSDIKRQIMTKAHVRAYCPSFDGSNWEGQDVAMSAEAIEQFRTLITHELGHAFGLDHSPAGPDMMFWKTISTKLSARDMKSIIRLYRIAKS